MLNIMTHQYFAQTKDKDIFVLWIRVNKKCNYIILHKNKKNNRRNLIIKNITLKDVLRYRAIIY